MLRSGDRDPWPKHLIWVQSDDVLHHFYWIEAPKAVDNARVEAKVVSNAIDIKTDLEELSLWLDSSLVNLSQPLIVNVSEGKPQTYLLKPNIETLCVGLEERGDLRLAAPARIKVNLKK